MHYQHPELEMVRAALDYRLPTWQGASGGDTVADSLMIGWSVRTAYHYCGKITGSHQNSRSCSLNPIVACGDWTYNIAKIIDQLRDVRRFANADEQPMMNAKIVEYALMLKQSGSRFPL
jgi:hypothetical protein